MSEITKRALAASLKKLLSKKTLDKITVTDIAEDCRINRHTFYYHFQDLYDLMEWMLLDEAKRVLGGHITYAAWKDNIASIFAYMKQNKTQVMNAYHSIGHDYWEEHLEKLARPYICGIVAEQAEGMNIPDKHKNFIIDIYVHVIVDIFLQWIAHDMHESYDDTLALHFKLLDGSLKYNLQKFIAE